MDYKNLHEFATQCLFDLERLFGPRDCCHVLSGITLCDISGPRISDPTEKQISIELPKRQAQCDLLLRWHIAHECAHLLDPHVAPINVLEEGIAVWYQNRNVTDKFREKTGKYRDAETLVEPNIENLFSIKSIRITGTKIGDIDWKALMRHTNVDSTTCKRLCERFSDCKPWDF